MGKQIWLPVDPNNFGSVASVRPYRLWGRVREVPRQPDRGRGNAIFSRISSKQYGCWFLVRSIFNTIIVIRSWNGDL